MAKRTLGRVIGVELYRRDAVVKRAPTGINPEPGKRRDVTCFSDASRRRLAFVANNTSVTFRTMVTLTYPRVYPKDGRVVKAHLRTFIQKWRRYTGGAEVLWFLEFQARGAPHVHILTDYPCPSTRQDARSLRLWVSNEWYDICASNDPRHLSAGTRVERIRNTDRPGAYALKYAQKMVQKQVPEDYRNVGRFWGHTVAVKPEQMFYVEMDEASLRDALVHEPYAPPIERPVYHVLYNKAQAIYDYALDGVLDNEPD